METKKCSKCNEVKSIEDFCKDKSRKSGINVYCRECLKKYYQNNIGYFKKHSKEYYKNNAEKLKGASKIYYYSNIEKVTISLNKYKETNFKDYNERIGRWHKAHPEKVKKALSDYKKRMKLISEYRLNNSVSRRINEALNGNKNGMPWEKLVGYSFKDLTKHLEKLFKHGMSWDNYGEWQLDHIIPRSFFKFSSFDNWEFKYCWSLNNLQPLWKMENIRKGNKV